MRTNSPSRTLGSPSASPQRPGLDFTAEHARHDRFVGRDALLARLDQLRHPFIASAWERITNDQAV
jgi:hypothetical protein